MSFSSSLKDEICANRPFVFSRKAAVCFGLALFGRSFDEKSVCLCTENRRVSRLFSELLYELVEISSTVTATERVLKDSRRYFAVTVDTLEDRLRVISFFAPFYRKFQCATMQKQEEFDFLHGMLCGAFLGCGHISDPQKAYHLEFVVHNQTAGEACCELLTKLEIKHSQTVRKGASLVYVKSSEAIEDTLTMLGAGKTALEIMNLKIYRDMRNRANRRVNCETANIGRTVAAAADQVDSIRLIRDTVGLDALPESLREIARLRLLNPDMPLSELAGALCPPISRSGAHYRLRQISDFAAKLAVSDGPRRGREP